jgi:hypothetical protein
MLDPAFLAGLSRTLARGAQDPEAAAALLESFRPETPIQAMLAAQAIALHHAAMDCFGRAMQAGEDDGAEITRLQRNAASLTRAFTATLHTLQRCQAETAREKSMQREPEWEQGGEGVPTAPNGDLASRPIPPATAPSATSAPQPSSAHKHPVQREESTRRPWEELTEAEQFAILYPECVAAGATSHEDIDLWLAKPVRPAAPARSAR